jgi:hypothetical protein
MQSALTLPSKIAVAFIVYLWLGVLITGVDLVFGFFPTHIPMIRQLHSATSPAEILWGCAGLFGVISVCLRRKPLAALATTLIFVSAYVLGANLIWRSFHFGCWLAIAALILMAIGSVTAMRSNNSFKPKPLRGSA